MKIIINHLSGDDTIEEESHFVTECEKQNSLMSLSMFMSVRTFIKLLDHQYEEARNDVEKSIELLPFSFSVVTNVYDIFVQAFLLAKDPFKDDEVLLNEHLSKLKKLSDSCPENFKHLYLLVQGQDLLTKGKLIEGTAKYEEAAQLAQKVGFDHIAGFSFELLAREWNRQKKNDFLKLYLKRAVYHYKKWGAFAKVNAIENKYQVSLEEENSNNTILDSSTLQNAYELMGRNLGKDQLNSEMLKVMVKNLNADSGAILEKVDDKFRIMAQSNFEDFKEYEGLLSFVTRSKKHICISKTSFNDIKFFDDYKHMNRSIIAYPLANRGIILLINKVNADAFSLRKVELLSLYEKQLTNSLDHLDALKKVEAFNNELEKEVIERTTELRREKEHAEEIAKNLKVAQEKLIEAAKDEARAEVASNVLHNVGNSVMTLTGYIELLEAKLNNSEDDKIKSLAQKVSQKLDLLMELIRSESQQAKKRSEEISLEKNNLEKLINDALIISDADSIFKITKDLDIVSTEIEDLENIKNILINFFSNSIKACQCTDKESKLFIKTRAVKENLLIQVTDNGIGMSEETMQQIFDAGFTTKDDEDSGYGLHNSQVVAQKMHGEIIAESLGVGQGATFTLKFPLK